MEGRKERRKKSSQVTVAKVTTVLWFDQLAGGPKCMTRNTKFD